MIISQVKARQILDSRGDPTVEAEVHLQSGQVGRASVPSGASTGSHEAHELRDNDPKSFNGLGVNTAIQNINMQINDALVGLPADDQFKIDQIMIDLDGTSDKSALGANAILAVSLANAHAASAERNLPLYRHLNDIAGNPQMSLPMPMMNLLNGGRHANGGMDIQECMIIPIGFTDFKDIVRVGSEVFQTLKVILKDNRQSTSVGDEGGFSPHLENPNSMAFRLLQRAVEAAGYVMGQDVVLAIDAAASEFFKDGVYNLSGDSASYSSSDLGPWYIDKVTNNFLVSIEDCFAEDEWPAWQDFTSQHGSQIQIVGDDFLVTNIDRLNQAIAEKSANAILVKPNQIGTLTETWRVIQSAQQAGWATIISHRSGETEDTTIAHIAVGMACGQIKTGSLSRTDRVSKYNELLRISELDPSLQVATPRYGLI